MPVSILLALPSSTNFQLKSFEFGGGGDSMSSTNFQAEGTTGELSGQQSSLNFQANSGLQFMQQSNVPGAPTLVNSDSWYNKLFLTLNASNNPSDTLFAIAISSDNWVTTQYVQDDNTVGEELGVEDYQTYTAWGGGTGDYIIGLEQGQTYKVKVKAQQGDFTESPYGPEATAATEATSISFDIDVASTDTESAPPYTIELGEMTPGNVTTATDNIWIDLSSNAENGAYVYVYDEYAGLKSTNADHTILSTSGNLSVLEEGYGLQVTSVTNLQSVAPYNGTSESVGLIDTTVREVLQSGGGSVTSGRASVSVKAKSSNTTPSASDYTDIITLIAAGIF